MGMLVPCLAAAILNGCAMQLFREPIKIGDGPLLALYIFIFSAFMLLWSIRLYPSNLRKIGKLQFMIEFLIAEFLMEAMIVDFWFPLEKNLHDALPALSQHVEEWLSSGDWSADAITDFLKSETTTPFLVSYVLALFFLLAISQASRVVDFTLLREEGLLCFIKQLEKKFKLGVKRLARQLGLVHRRVHINEARNTHQDYQCRDSNVRSRQRKNGKKNKKSNECPLDADVNSFEDLASLSDFALD